jgi:uncharacterized RDD family membrane protein YckC
MRPAARAATDGAAAAGFWRRCAAWSLDAALLALPIALLGWRHLREGAAMVAGDYRALLDAAGRSLADAVQAGTDPQALAAQWLADPALHAAVDSLQHALWALAWPPLLAFALLGAAWHAWFEASPRQATPGQRALGLRVVDVEGARVAPLRALARHVAGALSWLTLNLGHALALVPPERRALHDFVAGTRVVQDAGDAMLPAWARAWLWLLALALLWATVAWAGATRGMLQSAIDAALGI